MGSDLFSSWYQLLIPAEEMAFDSLERVRLWEEIALSLLTERYYFFRKRESQLCDQCSERGRCNDTGVMIIDLLEGRWIEDNQFYRRCYHSARARAIWPYCRALS